MIQRIDHRNNFDLIRLFAASQVLFMHALGWLKLPFTVGPALWYATMFPGVAIFFCISGFLVTQSFFQCQGKVSDFAIRRGLRIYPGLWTNYVFILVLLLIGRNLPFWDIVNLKFWKWLAASFVFGSDFFGFIFSGYSFDFKGFYKNFPSGVLWTISVELGFYVLVPIVFFHVRGKRWLMNVSMALWAAVSVAISMVVTAYQKDLDTTSAALLSILPLTHFWVFLIGAAVRVNWDVMRRFIEGKAWIWVPIYIASAHFDVKWRLISVLQYDRADPIVVIRTILLGFAVLSCAFTFRKLGSLLKGVDLSYGIYLYHMPIVMTFIGLGYVGEIKYLFILAALTVLMASLSWFLVEKPALSRKALVSTLFHEKVAPKFRSTSGAISLNVQLFFHKIFSFSRNLRRSLLPFWRSMGQEVSLHRRIVLGCLAWVAGIAVATFIWFHAESQNVTNVKTLPPIFDLAADHENKEEGKGWTTLGAAKAQTNEGALRIIGDDTTLGNQFQTVEIATKSGRDYIVKYAIEVSGGAMGLGVLDGRRGRWTKTVGRIESAPGILRFRAVSDRVRIVLFNNNSIPVESLAMVQAISVAPVTW